MKRWRRAQRLGLEPPIEVLAVLLKEEDEGEKASQRSVLDQVLLGSRGEVEV